MSDIYLSGGSKKIILNGTTYFASGGGGYTPTLITKTITENGTYSAEDDSADGYSAVTVDVPTVFYHFQESSDGKIVVRQKFDTSVTPFAIETKWFFSGYTKVQGDVDIPSELTPYVPTKTSTTRVMQAKAWTDDTSSTTNGWIGFLDPGTANIKIRSWEPTFSQLTAGTFWAVLDINGSTEQGGQTEPYSDPYDI